MPNYLTVLSECFPGVQAYTEGNPEVYEDLVWVSSPIDQSVLDASECAMGNVTYGSVEVQGSLTVGDTLVWNGNTWIPRNASDVAGSVMTRDFGYQSSKVKNRWLSSTGGNGFPSNEVPTILPWSCELVGMTFSNENHSVSTDVEIYSAAAGAAEVNTLLMTWQIRNARIAYHTDFTPLVFNRGDKLGLYLKDRGGDPDYPVVALEFKITDSTSDTQTENYSGDL